MDSKSCILLFFLSDFLLNHRKLWRKCQTNRNVWLEYDPSVSTTNISGGILNVFPAQCEHGCKHGECVGLNKCKCFPGFTGKTCNQGGCRSLKRVWKNLGQIEITMISFPVNKVSFVQHEHNF